MQVAAKPTTPKRSTPWGALPPRMETLHVATLHRRNGWLNEAFAADSASQIVVHEVVGVTAALARLREQMFDVVLVSHAPGVLDALEFVEGLRASGGEEPVIVLGTESEQGLEALCFEVGADGYCPATTTTTRSLIWACARAIERHQLIRENRRLVQAERQRLQYEHDEAERLLSQQRALVQDLEQLRGEAPETSGDAKGKRSNATIYASDGLARQCADAALLAVLPESLVDHYREMLRAYVIMGSGNLTAEMARLAELLASAGVTARQTIQLHVKVLEELIRGLGNRSARHVMNRADLLVLEVMVHLSEGYRQRYLNRVHPPQQLVLPGFDAARNVAG